MNKQTNEITPGPWKAVLPFAVFDGQNNLIARMSAADVSREQRDANVRAVAALPEIIDAYRECVVELCIKYAVSTCRDEKGQLTCEQRHRDGKCPADFWNEKLNSLLNRKAL